MNWPWLETEQVKTPMLINRMVMAKQACLANSTQEVPTGPRAGVGRLPGGGELQRIMDGISKGRESILRETVQEQTQS